MVDNMKCEQVGLIDELMQGKELAKQLCDHLVSSSLPSSPSSSSTTTSPPPSSHETNEVLIEKILISYEKALAMLNWKTTEGERKTKNGSMMDSHCSFTNGSPRSEVQNLEVKHKDVFKKRKTLPRSTDQVKVCSGTPHDGSLDDGYSWRKYGQKDILGAKFPRGYFRCTYRNVQGCLATKQVQKSDEDPMIYEITYKGRHTCTQASHLNKAFPSKAKTGLGENKHQTHQKNQPQQEKIEQPSETIFSFGSSLEVKMEDLENKEDIFPSFCFASPSIGSENEDKNIFSDSMIENNFMESFSPAFISPTTSESNIFCLSPCYLGSTGLGQSVQTSESDLTDIVSAPTSITNSLIMDFDFILDKFDFDTFFPLNTPELCSS
ncbi:probable WRKY transcription factor 53 [Abrus precatorius]|uniref:Probable WRKY transcription factor 53 n=1 Tax=Abrus precatorius TaxID=3816 RepID=A0A8B8JYZ5_ABRPR|nr:probable WRKY transcription factor 53 [Abrus precatorius]